jgi:glutamine synthetase
MNANLITQLYRNKSSLLALALNNLQLQNIYPKIGIELEFYLQDRTLINSPAPASLYIVKNFIFELKSELKKQNIDILEIEPEQGVGQIEIKTNPYNNILLLCEDLIKTKDITNKIAKNFSQNISANFASQPFGDDCTSAMQINLSFQDDVGNKLFAKNGRIESKILLYSIGGILKLTKNILLIAAPDKSDYLRFSNEINQSLYKNKKYTAPTNISWGYNNRTALVRIPQSTQNSQRRLEFRLPCANSDIYLAIFSLLIIAQYGIEKQVIPPPEIYGNSFDQQYNLQQLAGDILTAQKDFFKDGFLHKIIEEAQIMY